MCNFQISKLKLEWFVPIDADVNVSSIGLLKPGSTEINKRLDFSYFENRQLHNPRVFHLGNVAREELKTALRKKYKINGNIPAPVVFWKDLEILFEVRIVLFDIGPPILHIVSRLIERVLEEEDLMFLSCLPANNDALVFAINKIKSFLETGNISERVHGGKKYEFLPWVHIIEYLPRDDARSIEDDIPWNVIASIGTRHRKIQPDNKQLLPIYKGKNYTIRGDVCVVDKQSILLVSDEVHLEHRTVKFCALAALRIRQIIHSSYEENYSVDEIYKLFRKIELSIENQIPLSDSITFSHVWPRILEEFKILKLIRNFEDSSKEQSSLNVFPERQIVTNESFKEVSPLSNVVVALHGIRTHAKWQKLFSEVAQANGWICNSDRWGYGWFYAHQLLLPAKREAKIKWFEEQYISLLKDSDIKLDNSKVPSIVAHSFGTYVLGYALLKYDHIKFDKIILCGSILPEHFPWDKILERGQVQYVMNEIGANDFWSKLAPFFTPSTGRTGAKGFKCSHVRIIESRYNYSHSDFFTKGHIENKWIPFLNENIQLIPKSERFISSNFKTSKIFLLSYLLIVLGVVSMVLCFKL